MNKTKIEWCDSTWNPVTGCNHNCEYCYARGIVTRFGGKALNIPHELNAPFLSQGKKRPYPFGFTPTLHRYRLGEYEKKAGRTIFVCSMADLFGAWVPDSWIEEIFAACEKAPQHRYLFLTKNPERYCDLEDLGKLPIKYNMWYGTTITNTKQMERAADVLAELPAKIKMFFSIEPILEDMTASSGWIYLINNLSNWIILGAETGRRREKVVPEREWIEKITEDCEEGGIPLFMKDSLIPIIGEDNMRRELPRELRRTP